MTVRETQSITSPLSRPRCLSNEPLEHKMSSVFVDFDRYRIWLVSKSQARVYFIIRAAQRGIPSPLCYCKGKNKICDLPVDREIRKNREKYLDRFTKSASKVGGLIDSEAITTLCEGLQDGELLKSMVRKAPRTLAEFLARAQIFVNEEEYLWSWKEYRGETKRKNKKWRWEGWLQKDQAKAVEVKEHF